MRHKLQRGFRNSEFPAYSFNKYANSALKETAFKNPSVSTTNLVGGYKKERVKAGSDLSLSFLSSFSLRERPLRPLLAGKERECLLPPQGFGPEAKTRGGTLGFPRVYI